MLMCSRQKHKQCSKERSERKEWDSELGMEGRKDIFEELPFVLCCKC
jgi:hypothetical protein